MRILSMFFLFELSKFIRLVKGNRIQGATNVVRGNGMQKLVADTKWRQEDDVYCLRLTNKFKRICLFTTIKHFRSFVEQNPFISNHKND